MRTYIFTERKLCKVDNIENFVRTEAKAAAEAAVAATLISRKRDRRQRRRRKILVSVAVGGAFCTGFMVGVHRKVIKALVTGSEMPELPEGHPHFCSRSEN